MTKIMYIPVRGEADVKAIIKDILDNVKEEKIGLVTTAQFIDFLEDIKKGLKGKEVLISKGRPNMGQVLGCDAQAAKGGDAYVYIGTGKFHPTRVAMETGKKVYTIHPKGGDLEIIDENYLLLYEKKKAARIDKFNQAKRVGILVSTKPGQNKMKQALKLKDSLDKECFIVAANELHPDYLLGYDVDVWVNTACPRLAEDKFDKPVVDINEIPI